MGTRQVKAFVEYDTGIDRVVLTLIKGDNNRAYVTRLEFHRNSKEGLRLIKFAELPYGTEKGE